MEAFSWIPASLPPFFEHIAKTPLTFSKGNLMKLGVNYPTYSTYPVHQLCFGIPMWRASY